MKSKIEKTIEEVEKLNKNWAEIQARCKRLSKKQDKILKVLNSQSQPEEKTDDRCTCEPNNDELCEYHRKMVTQAREEIVKDFEDTPEEKLLGGKLSTRLYKRIESSGIDNITGDGKLRVTYVMGDLVSEVKQLLDEREREVLEKVLSELPEEVQGELKLKGHPDPVGRDGFPGDFDSNYEKLYEGVVDRLEIVQTKYTNLIYSIKKGLDKLNNKKK